MSPFIFYFNFVTSSSLSLHSFRIKESECSLASAYLWEGLVVSSEKAALAFLAFESFLPCRMNGENIDPFVQTCLTLLPKVD